MPVDRYNRRHIPEVRPLAAVVSESNPEPVPDSPIAPTRPRRHALGLPEGSIRALLALMLFGTIWALLVSRPERDLPGSLRDLVFIVLGHYFAARKRSGGGARVKAAATASSAPHPLYLPGGTIRLILVGGFVVVGMMLAARGQLDGSFRGPAGSTLILVGAFLLGVVASRLHDALLDGHPPAPWFEDLKALTVLGAAVGLGLICWPGASANPPPPGVEEVLASVIGFYFGNRS